MQSPYYQALSELRFILSGDPLTGLSANDEAVILAAITRVATAAKAQEVPA